MADHLRVDFICHGDDMPVCSSGTGMYCDAIAQKRFQLLKRTEGISTTQILERLLRSADPKPQVSQAALQGTLATTQRLSQFAAPAAPGKPQRLISEASKVVYLAGSFDLLHAGHVRVLEKAAQMGDYLLVGLYSDDLLRRQRGSEPVLTLSERALAVLSLRWVDDVVLGAPWEINQDLLTTMNIQIVVIGRRSSGHPSSVKGVDERFSLPSIRGILQEVESGSDLSSAEICRRFVARREEIVQRNGKLLQKDLSYIEGRGYVPEA
ncbi:unnamed protein product [Polarella glacialis]|uniref:ethanolamine-phosphate cytidylyltransferase n=1 Tax=Polarella glacialis TaxID=89957 RepID=A0A813KGU1_POLGL|nr:unnamed protein product [Polarella glacialis]